MNALAPGATIEGSVYYHGTDLYGPDIDPVQVRKLIFDRVRQGVQHDNLVERPGQPTFGAGAVVPEDVEEERVVQLAQRVDGVGQSADLVVGVPGKGREDLHLMRVELLLVRR